VLGVSEEAGPSFISRTTSMYSGKCAWNLLSETILPTGGVYQARPKNKTQIKAGTIQYFDDCRHLVRPEIVVTNSIATKPTKLTPANRIPNQWGALYIHTTKIIQKTPSTAVQRLKFFMCGQPSPSRINPSSLELPRSSSAAPESGPCSTPLTPAAPATTIVLSKIPAVTLACPNVWATGHLHALARELMARDLNIKRAAAEGRYVPLDATETLSRIMIDQVPDPERFSELLGGTITKAQAAANAEQPCTVVFGEMVALLLAEGKHEAAICLEKLWNRLGDQHSFSLRCAYPMSGFRNEAHGELFARICAEHSAVVPLGGHGLLLSDNEQLRTIATLQQKLEVFESTKALHQSEQRFRLLVEAVQDYAILTLDADGRVNSWNVGAERLKGYKASDILGEHFSRFYPEADVRAAKPTRELETAVREGRVEDEGWRVRKDGSKFWANVIITALKDRDGHVIGFSKVTRDFTERMQTERALQESKRKLQDSEKSLRELALHLLRSQDEERRRLGRDLHDSLGQYLSALKIKLDFLKASPLRMESNDLGGLAECAQLAGDALKEVRTISYLLYPPMLEEMGLKSAISWYLDGFTKRSAIKTTFEVSPDFGRLDGNVELALFRILQESLTNVHRHSGSQTAAVRLFINDDTVVLEVSDEGKGTQCAEEVGHDSVGALGVGLRGMSERVQQIGGKLELFSSKKGTTVTATVPLPRPPRP
jgi:PAS domain S-box-containing protein